MVLQKDLYSKPVSCYRLSIFLNIEVVVDDLQKFNSDVVVHAVIFPLLLGRIDIKPRTFDKDWLVV